MTPQVYRPPSEEEGAEDEGTLLSVTAGANVLSLVMRDQGAATPAHVWGVRSLHVPYPRSFP